MPAAVVTEIDVSDKPLVQVVAFVNQRATDASIAWRCIML
jgi:hypothetical protein